MGKDLNIILSGFGGQGLLFAGKIIAQAGLVEGKQISWLPSYGPEMRGGTAYCSVCVSDEPIGSPLVTNPNVLVAMNQPSVDRFMPLVESGGIVIVDSTLVPDIPERDDVTIFEVPATALAEENGMKKLANVILAGKVYKETQFCSKENLEEALRGVVPPKKQELLEPNLKALEIGMEQ